MDISKFDKADVLVALYNRAKVQGMGIHQAQPDDMTKDQARSILRGGTTDFDYLHGRVMKVNLAGDDLSTWLYDRDNGEGAAEAALAGLAEQAAA